MRRQRIPLTILALGFLFVTPLVWGCEETGMQNCSMSACPMTDEPVADDCHDSAAPVERNPSDCDAEPDIWISCCDAPADQNPARVDAASIWDLSTTPLALSAEILEIQPPPRPPDWISVAISTQRHELGRFTLLSSFLL
jgi:hypothetical protein